MAASYGEPGRIRPRSIRLALGAAHDEVAHMLDRLDERLAAYHDI
jgi:hypothetical protein